jgi:predicted RNase H-like HicB family nuclease
MKIVHVIYEPDEDGWVAFSPDVPRWTTGGDSFDEAKRLAEEGVAFALDIGSDEVELRHFVPAPTA